MTEMNYQLAASAIGVMVLILKETNVPNDRIVEAVKWALENLRVQEFPASCE